MEFRVLGPLEVVDGDSKLPLGGPRQRLVLAYLVLEANRVIPTDRLIDRIWGDEPPDAARSALFAYISRLKKLLGPTRVQARPPGYVLAATADEVDALRFGNAVAAARDESDPGLRLAALSAALQLWRGEPLSDLADHQALQPAITHLQEQRLTALEDQAEALLAAGRQRDAVPVLEALIGEHPLRERLSSLLMLALYRSGRQGEALAVFHRTRRVLDDELGIDPSPELRELHEGILRQEPDLTVLSGFAATREMSGVPGEPQPRASKVARVGTNGLVGVAAAGLLLIAAAIWWAVRSAGHLPPGPWTIAVDMPLSGAKASLGQLVRNAVEMAIDDINANGGVEGPSLSISVTDDGGDTATAVANAQAIVDDSQTIALVGPWLSGNTFGVVPITNQAGLLECSPSATHPGLTKPRYGALDLRQAHPGANNFVRIPPADDIQSLALAAFAYRDLAARSVLVIDDLLAGRELADAFATSYESLGGRTMRRTINPNAGAADVLDPLLSADPPQVVFAVADARTVAAVRVAMASIGFQSTPLLSWDALLYDSAVFFDPSDVGPYVENTTARLADGTYAAHATVPDFKFSFADAYRSRFDEDPDEYAAAGYACVEIVAAALAAIGPSGPTSEELRERVRAFVADPSHRFDTVVGSVAFDANGDSLQQFVTFYRFDASAANGAGDWIVFKKQDFGPAP